MMNFLFVLNALTAQPNCTPEQLETVDDICMEVTDDSLVPQCRIEAMSIQCK